MKIKGIEFKVNAASGALGWFGEGYWYHKLYAFIIPFFKRTMKSLNFVAKTMTWGPNKGNLPLDEKYYPKELLPKCIKVYPLRGMMLNAVSLSGPGFKKLIATGELQKVERRALGISFMPIGKTREEMLWETRSFRDALTKVYINDGFLSPIWVQVNQSCPNLKDHKELFAYTKEILEILQPLRNDYDLVLDLKVNLLVPNQMIMDIQKDDLCDLITLSNTIKFGTDGLGLNWKGLFWWSRDSPLAKLGGGGLSGKPLFKALCTKLTSLRREGIRIPIKASGGIFSAQDIRDIKYYGANAIEFATVISLRPRRVYNMVRTAKKLF